jgi:hypothetical protein
MINIPHVSDMICLKAFIGLNDLVREFSISFHEPTLGMSLVTRDEPGTMSSTPAIVGQITRHDLCPGVYSGDTISKINGLPVSGMNIKGVSNRIKLLPRPIIIHFIQVIRGPTIG